MLGQRLDGNGVPIDAEPFEIAGPAAAYSSPSVAWNGSLYLVTWVLQGQIYARRVAADGTLPDPAPIHVMSGQESSMAAVGNVFLVSGNDAPTNPEYVFVFGTRLRGSDGAILDPSPVMIGGSFSLHPKVGALGARWLVAWEQHPTHDDPHATVMGALVESDGAPGTPFAIGAAAAYNLAPAVTGTPEMALVAWSDSRNGFNNMNVFGRRVLPDGSLLDGTGVALSTAANNQTLPAVGWSGTEFVTLFQDARNIPYFFDEHLDVYGTRVTDEGTVLDPAGFPVGNDPVVSEIQPAVAGGNGAAVLGCAVFRSEVPIAAFRIGLRMLGSSVLTGVEAAGAPAAGVRLTLAVSPNPARGESFIRLTLPRSAPVSLTIHDVAGRLVRSMKGGTLDAGTHVLEWDGRDEGGREVATGVYLARVEAGGEASVVRMIRLR